MVLPSGMPDTRNVTPARLNEDESGREGGGEALCTPDADERPRCTDQRPTESLIPFAVYTNTAGISRWFRSRNHVQFANRQEVRKRNERSARLVDQIVVVRSGIAVKRRHVSAEMFKTRQRRKS